ncbi:MAG: homoserine kinase [Rhodospirillales bacterium]|nr:homoserine kinase [Rhodospirillales bacterium]
MAVYTDVNDEEVSEFVSAYDIGGVLACKGIAEGVENSNYMLTTETGIFILTLYERRVDSADLPFFLGLMEHLAARGIPCPTPVKARDGVALRELCSRPAAIVTFLPGLWPRRITTDHCRDMGEALARLHLASMDFDLQRTNNLTVGDWRPLLEISGQAGANAVSPGLYDVLAQELDYLEANWPVDLPVSTIHADLFPDNVFFRDGHLSGLIDFYFACTDAMVYDLAICLNAWCFEPDGSFNIAKARRMLATYRIERGLSEAELDALPILARGASIRFLLTRLYDGVNTPADALVVRKDPMEYMDKLRFHQGVAGVADYGLE